MTTKNIDFPELSEQQLEALVKLNPEYRQFTCLKQCQEQGVIVLLHNTTDDFPLVIQAPEQEDAASKAEGEDTIEDFIPIWSHPQQAQYFLKHNLEGKAGAPQCEIKLLPLEVFKAQWIDILEQANIHLALMPLSADDDFAFVAPDIFRNEDAAKAAAEASAKEASADLIAATKEASQQK